MNHTRGKDTVKVLGVKFNKLNREKAIQRFTSFMIGDDDETKMIFTPNAELVMRAQEDEEFMSILNKGDLVIPDGIGIIIASKIHHLELEERIPGIEFMGQMLTYANRSQLSIFLFGGKDGVADLAAEKIKASYPNLKIVGTQSGYYDEKDELKILDRINEVKPDMLFVALGAPKQEKWIYKHHKLLNVKVAMGVGGSLDVMSGQVKRAPVFFQKIGLEWFYRFLKEPTRFGRILQIPKFLIKVIFTRVRLDDE